tara:strand:+ start:2865 stop:3146 length:282 start_codon:yes stop_codon:yes gene_type:complete
MPKLVAFTRQNGDIEYTEFSYFRNNLSNAEMINEVYFGYDDLYDEEKGLARHKDTISSSKDDVYWFGDELVYVYRVVEITEEELETLQKLWIV